MLSLWNHWLKLSHYRKGAHITRLLYAALQIGGGLILLSTSPDSGTPGLIANSWSVEFLQVLEWAMLFCGTGLVFIVRPSLWGFFLLTSPFLLFVAFTVIGALTGSVSFAGAFILAICYASLFVNFWMYQNER